MVRRLLRLIGRLVIRHPLWVAGSYLLLTALAVTVTLRALEFRMDQNDLVAADLPYNQRYLKFLEEFGDLEFLYVAIAIDGDPERAVAVAEAVVEEVQRLREHVQTVFCRLPPETMGYGVLFQPAGVLEELAAWLEDHRELLAALARADRFERLFRFFADLLEPDALDDRAGEELARLGLSLLDTALGSLAAALERVPGGPAPSGPVDLEAELARDLGLSLADRGYLVAGNLLLVEILPVKDLSDMELIREPLEAIRRALDRVRGRFPAVALGLTGRPVLQADEMRTTATDMRWATGLALAGVFALFVLFFRKLTRPFLAVATLVVAILLAFGVTTLTVGHLTLLTVVFAAMLVGLGIDFGIHFVARYQEELAAGRDVASAIERTVATTGVSVVTGAITTAAAFYATLFVDFQGLRELGFVAGTGVLICLATTATLLPSLLVLADRPRPGGRGGPSAPSLLCMPLVGAAARHGIAALVVLALPTVAGLFVVRGIPYNANLLELQARDLESVKYELLLVRQSDFATWFAAFIVDSLEALEEARRQLEPARAAGIVGRTECVLDYVPRHQEAKLASLERAWAAVRHASVPAPSEEVSMPDLCDALEVLAGRLDELASLLLRRPGGGGEALRKLSDLAGTAERLAERFAGNPGGAAPWLPAFQQRWFAEWSGLCRKLKGALEPQPLTAEGLPYPLRRRLMATEAAAPQRFLLYAFPARDIWKEENMEEFVTAVRRIDPEVTGAPIQVYESARRMRKGFLVATAYSIAAVFVLLLVGLRSLRFALLALVPLVFGLLWLLEAMSLLGLEFNLANFFSLPILIGCGVDGGVHVVQRFRESGSAAQVARTTCSAVALSFLTTAVGFGALAIARHRGVASLGLVMAGGVSCILLSSVILLPALLGLVERGRRGR